MFMVWPTWKLLCAQRACGAGEIRHERGKADLAAGKGRPDTARLAHGVRESNGGGGGIRTRVRKYIPAGIYDAYPLLKCRSRREEAAKNRQEPAPENLAAGVRERPSATSLLK